MRLQFLAIVLFGILIHTSCRNQPLYEVQYRGSLRSMIHEGDISDKIDLRTFRNQQHVYALGVLENLKGEILIYDGVPYISVVKDTVGIVDSYNHKAALLVYTQVKRWQETVIPEDVTTTSDFENFLYSTANSQKLNVDEPFPFLIIGKVASMSWHVIDWVEGDTVHTHEKHRTAGIKGVIEDVEVEILGFHYDKPGIFTHHSSNIHMHAKTRDVRLTAHVDDIMLGDEMRLLLPTHESER